MSNEKLLRARERFIDSMAHNMNLYGITHSVGRLYGLLYFNNEPMTLDDMKHELGMSKTSMSTSVRQLHELKMVQKVWKRGERKDFYTSSDNWYQLFTDLFSIKWRSGAALNIENINVSLAELTELIEDPNVNEETKAAAKVDKGKLEFALEYYDWLNRLIDSLESNDIFEHIPKQEKDTH